MSRWRWLLRRLTRKLWFRAAFFALLAVVTALFSAVAAPFIPYEITATIGAEAVDNILGILASSMLAVTTFSLTTMVSAFSAATSNATPRATRLLIEDRTAQNAISTFLGSFLYAVVGIVALSTGLYGESGRVILFAVTVLVIVWIVVTLVRWMEHLSRLGRVGETTHRIETAAREALREAARLPHLGGLPPVMVPPAARAVEPEGRGYVQYIDTGLLSELAEEAGGAAHVAVRPGAYVHPGRPLLWLDGPFDDAMAERLRGAFTLAEERSYDQDPRFGLIVLSEIGSRALSPAVNDPGTAISVINAGGRLLAEWAVAMDRPPAEECRYRNLHLPGLQAEEMFDDFFRPLARDGAGVLEVGMRLQRTLAMLAGAGHGRLAPMAARHAREALARADKALLLPAERETLRRLAEAVPAPLPPG